MKNIIAAGAAIGLLALAALPATASVYPAAGVNARDVAAVLKSKGIDAEVTTDDVGDPMIKSAFDKLKWRVLFYECKAGRCASIQFQVGYDLSGNGMSYAKCNEWNFTKRFGRCGLDDEMDPYLRYDVDVGEGYTSESLGFAVDTWVLIVPSFSKFIDF